MSTSLVLGLLSPLAAVAEGEVPEEREQATVVRQAYYNGDNSTYTRNAATTQFPPQAVCLVEPRACFFPEEGQEDDPTGLSGDLGTIGNETLFQLNEAEQALLDQLEELDDGSGDPPDPVQEGDFPVSVAFGQPNYRSAVEFELPSIPAGEEIEEFFVVLQEGQPTYANESPALRQAVTAALTCASEDDSTPLGRCNSDSFEQIAEECPDNPDGTPCLQNGTPLLVEACPITGEWTKGPGQDEDTMPEVDCLFSTVGERVEADVDGESVVLWVFDLTFAAKAWYGGTMTYNGILLRPGAAENFAYGDPETTYTKQVTLTGTPMVAAASAEPVVFQPPPSSSSGDASGGGFTSNNTTTTGTSIPPSTSGSTPGSGVPVTTNPQQPAVSQPETAPQQPVTSQQPSQQPTTLAAGMPLGEPENPWWLWLLVPVFLGGAWMLARSLQEEAAVAAARSGAMTRLLERQAVARRPDLVTQ